MKTKIGQPVPELPVQDLQAALAYYQKVLGFQLAWSFPDIGAVSLGEVAIFLREQTDAFTPQTHWIFAEDIDATYQELSASPANITEPLENKPWGLRQFTSEDLNGHRFYVHHDLGDSRE